MQIAPNSRLTRNTFCVVSLLAASAYLALVTLQFLCAYFSERLDLESLTRAVHFAPGNAEYQHRLGRYYMLVQRDPEKAAASYRSAVRLDPYHAEYWFDLSKAYLLLGKTEPQKDALMHAVAADPNTPEVAWEAANLYWARGEPEDALREFRIVLENDPSLCAAAVERCWRIEPDIDALLQGVVPRNQSVYATLLEFLIARKEMAGAAKVWEQMARLQQPVDRRNVNDYIRYLVEQREVTPATAVWRQAAALSDLNEYQPAAENLVVNGGFNLPMLNGGFDWLYDNKAPDVSLSLDATEPHIGHRSLSIAFDSRGLEDAGIRQFIPVMPNTRYQFTAYFKSEDMQGAGGPRFVIQDRFSGTVLLASDELKGPDFWRQVEGSFVTKPDTVLVELRVQRYPSGDAIRGKLWIDDIRLVSAGVGNRS